MFRTKSMAGFTLYPGKAYLEMKGKLFNRTPFAANFFMVGQSRRESE